MKTFRLKFALLFALTAFIILNTSTTILKATPLNGTYTIGSGSGHDFSSFQQAIDTLSYYGVTGPVIFHVDTGTFNEQIVIPGISGSSAINTVTFMGAGDSTLIYYTPSSANRPVVCFDNASHIIFDSIKVEAQGNYGIGIHFFNGSDSITVRNCYIEMPNISSTYNCVGIANYSTKSGTGTSNTSYVNIENNTVEKGYEGIRIKGDLGSINNIITGNIVFDFGSIGIQASGNTNINIIGNNVFSTNSPASRGIDMWPTGHSTKILNNTVEISSSVNHTRLIQVANPPGGGGTSFAQEVLVANNFVRYYGTYTSNMTGIYTKHTSYLRIYNNTIRMSTGSGAKSLWLDALSSTTNIVVKNNNLSNYITNGELLRVHNSVTATLDYNNFYMPSNFKIWWKGTSHYSLSAYKSSTSQGANSVSIDPQFVSSTNMHIKASNVAFDGLGTPLSQINYDIDGESRDANNPDIGADEYASCADVSLSSLINPTNCTYIDTMVSISVRIKNLDTNSIKNIKVSYRINGGSVVTELHTTPISGLDSALHTFTTSANFGIAGIYTIKTFTASVADHNPNNDTLISSVTITPLISNLPDSTGACNGSSILLQPGNYSGASYLWSDSSSNSTLLLDTSNAGTGRSTYWVNITGQDGCNIFDSVLIIFNSPANVSLGNDTSLCANDTLYLNVTTTGASYLWQDNSTQAYLNITSSGTYWVKVSTGYGCTVSDTLIATFYSLPVFNLGSDTSICIGDSIIMDATVSNATYNWQNSSSQPSFTAFVSGTYWAEVTDSFGCSETDTLILTVDNYPIVNLRNDTTVCQGVLVVLDATSPGSTYLWQDNSMQSLHTASVDGTYWVEVTNSTGCMTKDSFSLTVLSLPVFSLGNDTAICDGDSIVLDATTPNVAYLWQDNSTNPTFTAFLSGFYKAELTNVNGCKYSDSLLLTVNQLPVINLGNDTAICAGENLLLDATSTGNSYLWQDNSTNSTFNAFVGGDYWVELTNLAGCKSIDSMNLKVNSLPVFSLGNDTSICEGETLVLDATTSGATYLWNDNTTLPTLSISNTGYYWVEVTNLAGCKSIDSMNLMVDPLPVFSLGNDTSICEGEILGLDVSTIGATYLWQDNSTQSAFVAYIQGVYWVKVTNNKGCSAVDSLYLNVNPLPQPNLIEDTTITIQSIAIQNFKLNANTGYKAYLWSTGDTTEFIEIDTSYGLGSHEFWTRVADANGCIGYDSVTIEIVQGVGINELENYSFEIMPNPSRGKFMLNIHGFHGEISVFILNLNGQVVFFEDMEVVQGLFSKSFDISMLPKGIYNLAIKSNKGVKNMKLLLQ